MKRFAQLATAAATSAAATAAHHPGRAARCDDAAAAAVPHVRAAPTPGERSRILALAQEVDTYAGQYDTLCRRYAGSGVWARLDGPAAEEAFSTGFVWDAVRCRAAVAPLLRLYLRSDGDELACIVQAGPGSGDGHVRDLVHGGLLSTLIEESLLRLAAAKADAAAAAPSKRPKLVSLEIAHERDVPLDTTFCIVARHYRDDDAAGGAMKMSATVVDSLGRVYVRALATVKVKRR